ncbi:iron complex outermembrane receptor protein [Pseudomonas duriflava]|uniref:Iron complex outermembrane receptor protein n=1 Tax=Pseudomonas duriflava TaxID=459528 RepID=A0A562QDJ1_9PSED|nr:TonB-dependent receptor [Pseudomonas duriflava]TWI54818.1 iron complex outermembrane receptor protein [Pseudomonas duriflava]
MKLSQLYVMLWAAGMAGWASGALAQESTESESSQDSVDVGAVNVRGQSLGNGQMVQEDSGKARSTVTKEALEKMNPAANALDKLKYTPGINVSSDDATGLSGTTFTMRGMSSSQVGISSDGIPINDSGDYNIYPNLLGDPENLGEIFVTQGSSEADAPHIGSSGGNIGLVTMRPEKDFGVFFKQSLGTNDLTKTFARLNTGEHNGFSSFISASHEEADKWKGKGSLKADKVEWNALFEGGNGNSTNAIVKYHRQENYNYYTISKGQYEQYGRDYDYSETLKRNSSGQISSYYKLNRNPFENLTASLTQRFQLRDDLTLTFQPYYYWANGGSFSPGSASSLSSTSDQAGNYDLSNLSYNTYYRPSWSETWRPGVTTKLKWDFSEQHSLDFGYWYERARQRQTQPFISIEEDGTPDDIWADYGSSNQVVDANGNTVQGRNYYTVTPAQKLWVQDTWYFSPDLTFTTGLSYEYVERKGNNRGSLYDEPEKRNAKYHEFLPNFSAKYQINEENQAFYNVTRNMRTPQNYVLYNTGDSISLNPELSWNQELGWRFTRDDMALSATLFYLTFKDRQLSSYDTNGDYVMINVGDVVNKGLELEWSGLLPYNFNYYASYTYTDSEQQDDITTRNTQLPTSGKQVANVPKNMFNLSFGYDDGRYYGNIVGKYVGSYYGDLTNDEKISGRTVFDLNTGVRLPVNKKMFKSAAIRFSVANLFDKEYLSSARTIGFNAQPYNGLSSSTSYYNVGEERTAVVSFEASF